MEPGKTTWPLVESFVFIVRRSHHVQRLFSENGGAGESRTPDTQFRKLLLYPSELQPHEDLHPSGNILRTNHTTLIQFSIYFNRAPWQCRHGYIFQGPGAARPAELPATRHHTDDAKPPN